MQVKTARQVLGYEPGILSALNKTEYFMNQLKDFHPEIACEITPLSEYSTAKEKILFNTKFGVVSTSPDTLLAGHSPTIRAAVDRKSYFYNQLKYLYQDYPYDFIVDSTSRHEGKVKLLCKLHGEQSVDSDWIFSGCGCPVCNKDWNKSTSLYIVRLSSDEEIFYKLGISYRLKSGDIRRYKDYKSLNYKVEELFCKDFDNYLDCVELEFKLKKLIKDFKYTPLNWSAQTSTECFKDNLIEMLIKHI